MRERGMYIAIDRLHGLHIFFVVPRSVFGLWSSQSLLCGRIVMIVVPFHVFYFDFRLDVSRALEIRMISDVLDRHSLAIDVCPISVRIDFNGTSLFYPFFRIRSVLRFLLR